MRKFTLFALVLGMLAALPSSAQIYGSKSYPLATSWNLNGQGLDVDGVLIAEALADSHNYTASIDGQPDVCRLIDLTIADALITAGTVTVVGVDCWGNVATTTWNFTAADDDGVHTLGIGNAGPGTGINLSAGAYYASITSITTGVLTGEAVGDTLAVGWSVGPVPTTALYGRRIDLPTYPWRAVDLAGQYVQKAKVTNGLTQFDLTAVDITQDPFQDVVVGDLIGLNIGGDVYWYKVLTHTDDDNVILDRPAYLPAAAGQGFDYRHFYTSADPEDGWFAVKGYDAVDFLWQEFRAGTNTGGIISSVQCAYLGPLPATEVDTDTIASGVTGSANTSVDLRLAPFDLCKISWRFGTTDDAQETAATSEAIYAHVSFRY